MSKLSVIALLGLLSYVVDGALFIVGTTKPVTGSKAHRRALAARDGGVGDTNSLLDILDLSTLLSVSGLDSSSVLYHYSNSATGFAATMTQEQADSLAEHPDVLYIVRDSNRVPATTRTPKFLGIGDSQALLGLKALGLDLNLDLSLEQSINLGGVSAETDIVIGVLDSGIWPELPSFNDDGLPPPPSHWKGECVVGEKWARENCNNKIVGARWSYYQGYLAKYNLTEATFNGTRSARADEDNHGTFVSSIAAGARVPNASLFGQANGTARGMAVGARLAAYKVCWGVGELLDCLDSDFLAAFDDAIEDGVNVLSLSQSSPIYRGYDLRDVFTVATFRARQKGITTFQCAGNSGPDYFTNFGGAPWIMSVGASTLDRDFPSVVVLSDGTTFVGEGIARNDSDPSFKPLFDGQVYDFIVGTDAGLPGTNVSDAEQCADDTLDSAKVAGKIVICKGGGDNRAVFGANCREAGAAGMIFYYDETVAYGPRMVSNAFLLPATALSNHDGVQLVNLVRSGGVQGTIKYQGTVYGGVPAPQIATFTSRGPHFNDLMILKPDITGPGVSILGASANESPSSRDVSIDTIQVSYNIESGTSMSAPHLAGIAAFVKARRPDFTAAMIHSALMTTAYSTLKDGSVLKDATTGADSVALAFGNGQVDPVRALDPGLVYDNTNDDLIKYTCGKNSSDIFIRALTESDITCGETISSEELNYPSFSAVYDISTDTGTKEITFSRTLTHVGGADGCQYAAEFSMGPNPLITVTVVPDTLTFTGYGDKQSYIVKVSMQSNATFVSMQANATSIAEMMTSAWGRLTWSDGEHLVASSLSFMWMNVTSVTEYFYGT